jgi:hypothetical protein
MHFLRGEDRSGFDFPRVQDLSTQRQDRLEVLVARLLRAAAGRVAFDQEQFRARQVARGAVGELAGQGGALRDLLAHDLLLGLEPQRRALDRNLGDALAEVDVLVQEQGKAVVCRIFHKSRRIARRQTLLGLPGELRILHFQAQHEAQAIPDILGREP